MTAQGHRGAGRRQADDGCADGHDDRKGVSHHGRIRAGQDGLVGRTLDGRRLAAGFNRDGKFANVPVLATIERLACHHGDAARKETPRRRIAHHGHGAAVVRRDRGGIVDNPAAATGRSRTHALNDVAWTLYDGWLGVTAHGDGEGANVRVLTAVGHPTRHGGDPDRQCGADGWLADDVVVGTASAGHRERALPGDDVTTRPERDVGRTADVERNRNDLRAGHGGEKEKTGSPDGRLHRAKAQRDGFHKADSFIDSDCVWFIGCLLSRTGAVSGLGPKTAAVLPFWPRFQGLFQAAGKHTQILLIAGRSPGLTSERVPHPRAGLIAFTP